MCDELAKLKEEMNSIMRGRSCDSSAASTSFGLGSGTFAWPPPLGQNGKEAWMPRKIDIKGWVEDWSQKEATGLTNDRTMEHTGELETDNVEVRVTFSIGKTQTTIRVISLWCMTNAEKGQMFVALKVVRRSLAENDYKVRVCGVRPWTEPAKKTHGESPSHCFSRLWKERVGTREDSNPSRLGNHPDHDVRQIR